MVFLPRSLTRVARPSFPTARALCTTARAPAPQLVNPLHRARASSPRIRSSYRHVQFRWLTGQREKVKVLLVLYDGKEHAKDVSLHPLPIELQSAL